MKQSRRFFKFSVLRRNYAEYIKSGKKSGWGFGAFIYEPRQGFDIEK